jgi:hypothetical protein
VRVLTRLRTAGHGIVKNVQAEGGYPDLFEAAARERPMGRAAEGEKASAEPAMARAAKRMWEVCILPFSIDGGTQLRLVTVMLVSILTVK